MRKAVPPEGEESLEVQLLKSLQLSTGQVHHGTSARHSQADSCCAYESLA